MATIFTEGVVSSPELAGDLLVGRPAPGHQHDVEAREAADGKEHQGYDAHDDHGDDRRHLCQTVFMMQHMDEAEDKDANHVECE